MDKKLIGNENNIVFYTDEEGNLQIEVVLQDENVWLNVNAIAELFDVQRPAITKHINNIYNENDLKKKAHVPKWNVWVIRENKNTKLNIIILI